MSRLPILLAATLLLSGCGGTPHLVKLGATRAQLAQDDAVCRLEAARAAPLHSGDVVSVALARSEVERDCRLARGYVETTKDTPRPPEPLTGRTVAQPAAEPFYDRQRMATEQAVDHAGSPARRAAFLQRACNAHDSSACALLGRPIRIADAH